MRTNPVTVEGRETAYRRSEPSQSMLIGALFGAAMAASFFAVTNAAADGSTGTESVPRVVPFAGELALDGQVYSGVVDLRISLYDELGSNTALWTEVHDAIPVTSGRFSVLLGATGAASSDGLRLAVSDASRLYVGVEVKADAAPASGWAALAGKSLLGPSPYALWAPQSTNMTVARNLVVGGAATAGSLSSTGDLYVDKTNATVTLGQPGAANRSVVFGDDVPGDGAQMVYQPASDELSVVVGQTGTGASRLTIKGATGALAVTGAATLGGAVSVDGDVTLASGGPLTLASGYIRIGEGAKGRKGVVFGSTTAAKGMKVVMDAGARQLSFEGGQNTTQNSTDILTIAQSSGNLRVGGNLKVGRYLITGVSSWSTAVNIESGADKSYQEDSGCTVGAVRGISANGGGDCDGDTPEAGVCICAAPAGKSKGWFCWH